MGRTGFSDHHRFLPVLGTVSWITVPLLLSHCGGDQTVRFPWRSSLSGDYIWFDPLRTVQRTVDVAGHGRKASCAFTNYRRQWETVPSALDSRPDSDARMAGAITSLVVELTFGDGGSDAIEGKLPAPVLLSSCERPCAPRFPPVSSIIPIRFGPTRPVEVFQHCAFFSDTLRRICEVSFRCVPMYLPYG